MTTLTVAPPTVSHNTLLVLDHGTQRVRQALIDPWQMHRLILDLYPLNPNSPGRAQGDILYATTLTGNIVRVMVRSTIAPVITSNYRHLLVSDHTWVETHEHPAGTPLRFMLTANPARKIVGADGKKRVRSWSTEEQRLEWLAYQGTRHGFHVDIENITVGAATPQWIGKEYNPDIKARVDVSTYQGTLTVTDPPRFAHACQTGIGRAKAFGCGLLLTHAV